MLFDGQGLRLGLHFLLPLPMHCGIGRMGVPRKQLPVWVVPVSKSRYLLRVPTPTQADLDILALLAQKLSDQVHRTYSTGVTLSL